MKALYRKYRPTKISDVIGQDQVTKPLSSALKSGNFSHSYLFTGPRGCGKTSVARIFAHEVNGFPYEIEDSYTDIIEIDAASNTGVDNIRELREKAAIAPSTGKYKVYIIDEVHMLSKSAFNALLKTLEEPPRHVIFIMATTDAYKVPITITSRAQVYNFQLASPDVMLKHLKSIAKKEKIAISDDALSVIVARGGGSFRDSISLLDQISNLKGTDASKNGEEGTGKSAEITKEMVENALGLPEAENCQKLLDFYEAGNGEGIIETLKNTLNSGVKPEILAENLIEKIIDVPKPALLPLLAKLPEVKAPFAEAKVLLAFLGDAKNAAPAKPVTIALNSPKLAKEAPRAAQKPPETSTLTNTPLPEKTPETAPEMPKTAKEAPKTPVSFNWEAYLEGIEPINLGIASTLKKCNHRLNGNTLQIITERKVHKSILSSVNNLRVLQKFLPEGLLVEIIDRSEIDANSKEFSEISGIMGSVTEVKTDDVPFN